MHKNPIDTINTVCLEYKITYEQLRKPDRTYSVAFPRHLCMFLLKKKHGMSLADIGRMFNRDHTTVIHAITRINNYLDTDQYGKRREIMNFY